MKRRERRERRRVKGASVRSRLRFGAAVLAACGLGALGLWWAVAGGGPAATVRGRAVTSVLFFLVAGGLPRLMLGSHRRRLDWLLVPVVVSGPMVLGCAGVVLSAEGGGGGDLPLALLYVAGPPALAVLGWMAAGRAAAGPGRAGRRGADASPAQGTR